MRVRGVQRPKAGISQAGELDSHVEFPAPVVKCLCITRLLTSLLAPQTLTILKAYPTTVEVCIICNEEDKLQPAISRWTFKGVRICKRDAVPTDLDGHFWPRDQLLTYMTTWLHHSAFEEAIIRGGLPLTRACK